MKRTKSNAKAAKVRNETIETREIEFGLGSRSSAGWRAWLASTCERNAKHGLTMDPTYSCNNGGVCVGFKFTGPAWVLDWLARYGYGA